MPNEILCLGLIFFQDKASIDRLLSTVPDKMKIIAIDGRLLGYPSVNEISTDGSRELLQKRGATIIDVIDKTEFEKRDAYLRAAEKDGYSIVMVVDSDHQLVGDWGTFYESIQKNMFEEITGLVYSMPVYTQGIDNVYRFSYMPLILYRPEKLHYEERHDKICHDHVQQMPKIILNGIMQINNHDLRTQDRIAKGYIFKVISRKVETGKEDKKLLEIFKGIGW